MPPRTSGRATPPVGHELSQQIADFTATCCDDSDFHLADRRGKAGCNKVSSVTPELLKALYEEASK